jgi:hypothetical protein
MTYGHKMLLFAHIDMDAVVAKTLLLYGSSDPMIGSRHETKRQCSSGIVRMAQKRHHEKEIDPENRADLFQLLFGYETLTVN